MNVSTASIEATRTFGARVALLAQPGDVYALEGDLGTGKTEFVRGFVGALDKAVVVRSPSFSIVNIYACARFPVYHFDFYRLTNAGELGEIGFDEYLAAEGVCLIEWGTMFPSVLPSKTRILTFKDVGVQEREINCTFDFDAGKTF